MIILIEGTKNVGKTYLIEKSKYKNFKFPFIDYFKEMIAKSPDDTGASSKEAFHFSTSFDVTILAMNNHGHIKTAEPLLIDRSFLSNVVLGELQGRITQDEGKRYLDYLAANYALAPMIYITKEQVKSGRAIPKDDWEFLGYEQQNDKAEEYLAYLKDKHKYEPRRFVNKFNQTSVDEFTELITELQYNEYKKGLRDAFGLDGIFNKDFLKNIGL